MMSIQVENFFHGPTNTLTYVVYDDESLDAVVIDPVLDYEPHSSTVSKDSLLNVESFILEHKLVVHYILETHPHADHLSGAQILKRSMGEADVVIGLDVIQVQKTFSDIYNLDFPIDGSQFDVLLKDGETLVAGSLEISAIATPGHTPACTSYLICDKIFTGDVLFMPDGGTGRCDFPHGSASQLYSSIMNRIYTLPDETEIYTGHDYMPNGRDLKYKTTIGEQKAANIHLKAETTLAAFVSMREARDKTLTAPQLLLPSIQFNIQGGHFPIKESNGGMYLKIPFNLANIDLN